MNKLQWKRVSDSVSEDDGFRILIDRLWPRGEKKEAAKIDCWAKEITPTKELRESYHKGMIDYETFSEKYGKELEENTEFKNFVQLIEKELQKENVTMVSAVKEPETSHIPVLRKYIERFLQ